MREVIETFRRKPWLLAVAWGGFLIMGYFILPKIASTRRFHFINSNDTSIHSKIKQILEYSHGYPGVALADGRNVLLHIGDAGQKYVQANDSIVKQLNSEIITVYRRYAAYTDVSVFGDGGNMGYQYSGLLKRYRIPNPPQAEVGQE